MVGRKKRVKIEFEDVPVLMKVLKSTKKEIEKMMWKQNIRTYDGVVQYLLSLHRSKVEKDGKSC